MDLGGKPVGFTPLVSGDSQNRTARLPADLDGDGQLELSYGSMGPSSFPLLSMMSKRSPGVGVKLTWCPLSDTWDAMRRCQNGT